MSPPPSAGDGWSWCVPLPTADTLNSVWSSSATDGWAVGNFGTLLHFDGHAWSAWPSGTQDFLLSLWGSSANDVWAVGDKGTTLHWNGATWLPVPSGTTISLYGVWGLAANDVWAVGWATAASGMPNSTVLHWNGSAWASTASIPEGPDGVSLTAIWASSDTDVYVVGGDSIKGVGVMDHWDGSTWSPVPLPTSQIATVGGIVPTWSFTGIWGASATDVWATGANIYAFHFKGGAWTYTQGNPDALQGPMNMTVNVSGTSASDVFSSNGYHWDGITWSGLTSGGNSAFARTPSDAWIVGTNGSSSHYDGTTWTTTSPTVPDSGAFNGLSATAAFSGVWASGPDDVYLIGASAAYGGTYQHWDGHVWTSFPDPLFPATDGGSPLNRPELASREVMGGSSASDIWIIAGMVTPPQATEVVGIHWDGKSWSTGGYISLGTDAFGSLWVTGPTDAWLTTPNTGFGTAGGTFHWDGSSWKMVTTGLANPGGPVWASAPDDVWVFDEGQGAAHWNGSAWSVLPDGGLPDGGLAVSSAWGSGRDDLWAVSRASKGHELDLLHWDGTSWTGPTAVDLTSVLPLVDAGPVGNGGGFITGSASNNVWVSGGGYVAHWDGASWTPSALSNQAGNIIVVDGGAGWAAGNSTLLCHPPDAASSEAGSSPD